MGRLKTEKQCTPANCNGVPYSLQYSYDYAGNIQTATDPLATTPYILSYDVDTANRLQQVTSTWSGDAEHPAILYSASSYSPFGLGDATLGSTISIHRNYDNRGRLYQESDQGSIVHPASAGTTNLAISFTEQTQGTAATGQVTLGGTEQSAQVLSRAATSGYVTVSMSGSERSTQVLAQGATSATGSVTISGAPNRQKVWWDPSCGSCWDYVVNSGFVTVSINGFSKSTSYSSMTDTSGALASSLASAFNADSNSPVTASVNGSVVYFTSKATGAATNYSLSSTCTYDSGDGFSSCSFVGTPSGPNLQGGSDATYNTVYDSGTVSLTLNGYGKSVSYGQNSSQQTIAADLAAAFNSDGNSPVTAGSSGSNVTFTAKQAGAGTNYGFTSSSSTNSGYFSGTSFTLSPGSGSLGGGQDNQYSTTYDVGTITVTVNGYPKSISFGQGSSSNTLASSLASALTNDASSPVTATVSGSVITLTTRQVGGGVDFPLETSTSYDTAHFSQSSFNWISVSGSALTGGSPNGLADAGTVTMTVSASPTFSKTVNYGASDTASSITSKLASAYAGDSSAPVTVSVNGSTLTLTAKQAGLGSNYGVSLAETHDAAHFGSPSFLGSSGGSLSGGTDRSVSGGTIYSYNVSFAPNGNVTGATDSVMGTWLYGTSTVPGYDDLNRLVYATSTAGLCAGMNASWSYDAFGNRRTQAPGGSSGCTMAAPNLSFTRPDNRIDGPNTNCTNSQPYCYDLSGDLLNDGLHSYTYDAEERISTVDGTTKYIYDGESRRVAKVQASNPDVVTASYVIGPKGEQVTEMNATGAWVHSNVYVGSALTATYDGFGTRFQLSDWLGSRRVQAHTDGTAGLWCFNYPFGDGLKCWGPDVDATEHHFTGKERDTETGLDYFGARYYGSNMGRFMSTDPYLPQLECKNASCFSTYVANPQNWNKYTYTRNNPLAFIDPDGEKTELAVGGNTADNPFGHVALIINGRVYSYGTNYNKGAARDWGADASVYLNAQSGSRQTEVLQLNITPEQEQSLQQNLEANNPNSQAAAPYDVLGNSCVTVTVNALQNIGILPTPQPGPEAIGKGGAVYQAGADKSITPTQLADRVKQQSGLVQQTTTSGQQKVSVFRSFVNLFKKKTGSE
jgi:RHS repeat-associated protein